MTAFLITEPFVDSTNVRPEVSCRICESRNADPYLKIDEYQIVTCLDCGLRYVNPQPSEKELESFYSGFDSQRSWRGEAEEAFDRSIRATIQRWQSTGAVLDVGSSKGNFLVCMREAGFSVYGIEPSEKNRTFARQQNGIPSFPGTAEAFLLTPITQQFQIITLLNVLEHLRNPKQVLLGLRARLADGGFVVIVVPDCRFHAAVGTLRRLAGSNDPYWIKTRALVGFDPPQHLCSFEPRTLALLVEQCGFEKVLLRNAPVIYNNSFARDIAKFLVHGACEVLYRISLGQLLVGYSTLIIARRTTATIK
jgi:SAM-dependent methyltransferase